MDTRQERERDFHNHIFDSDERRVVDKYYTVTNTSKALYRQYIQEIPPQSRVLEYGCGPGSEAFALAQRGCNVIGIDISDVAIAQAEQRAVVMRVADNTEFTVMDAENLTYPDASFDYVCGSGILHHLDIQKALTEIARVLKPDGKAIFFEPLGHNPLINLYRTLTPRLRTVDEHPLKMPDFSLIRNRFNTVTVDFFHLTVLGSVVFRHSLQFERIRHSLESFDQYIFRRMPVLRRYAWMSVITFGNTSKKETL
jgi:ubiquinone/menaquinone biosynthesis C-methylase UbiE